MKRTWTSSMSREGRDTLWLLCVLALSMAPHWGHLPLWCALGAATSLLWRGWLAWHDKPLPGKKVLLICMILLVILTAWTYRALLGREVGITLLTILAGLKTLELRARRDAFVVTALGFFLVLTQFLYSQGPAVALLMLVVVMGLLSSLVLAQRPNGRPSIASALRAAGGSLVLGVPLMVAFYVLFPRIGPLWSLPSDAGAHTGLSDQLTLGRVAELALDDSVAMRVRFSGAPPAPRDLYFRGPVLDAFDGRNWTTSPATDLASFTQEAQRPAPHTAGITYEVTLEPNGLRTLPLLDGTLQAQPSPPQTTPALQRHGLNWVTDKPLTERSQIQARAWPGLHEGESLRSQDMLTWTMLPKGFQPRTRAWAQRFQSQMQVPASAPPSDPQALVAALLQHIRTSGYRYTLSPGDTPSAPGEQQDPIDQFWLDNKAGFCEHFATAFVVVLRAIGIPSRVVTGYQGAEPNLVDGLYMVRNSDAHAWAEYWLPHEGWIRVDPTAAVAPDRIDRGRPQMTLQRPFLGPLGSLDAGKWRQLRAYMEAGQHHWNMWVLSYSRQKQEALMRDWGITSPDWSTLLRLCAIVMVTLSMLGLLALWWTRPRHTLTAWQRHMQHVHRLMLSIGLTPSTEQAIPLPALAWIEALNHKPLTPAQASMARPLIALLTQLDSLQYGAASTPTANSLRQAREVIKQIQSLARRWALTTRQTRSGTLKDRPTSR